MSNRYNIEVQVNGVPVHTELDTWGYMGKDSVRAIECAFLKTRTPNPKIGDTGSINVTITWKHIRKTREWSAATKAKADATRAANRAIKDAAFRAEQQAKQKKALLQLQERVKHQVDHAFALGKHGTEPASKFITCGHCNAPAVFLGLSQPLAGAQVVNEDAIMGVVCKEHYDFSKGKPSYYTNYTRGWVETIPCSRLEFFYDGVRQIAVKSDDGIVP